MKSVRIWSYSGLYLHAFGLNTEKYSVSLRIHSECEKMRTRITTNTYTFHAVWKIDFFVESYCLKEGRQQNIRVHFDNFHFNISILACFGSYQFKNLTQDFIYVYF